MKEIITCQILDVSGRRQDYLKIANDLEHDPMFRFSCGYAIKFSSSGIELLLHRLLSSPDEKQPCIMIRSPSKYKSGTLVTCRLDDGSLRLTFSEGFSSILPRNEFQPFVDLLKSQINRPSTPRPRPQDDDAIL